MAILFFGYQSFHCINQLNPSHKFSSELIVSALNVACLMVRHKSFFKWRLSWELEMLNPSIFSVNFSIISLPCHRFFIGHSPIFSIIFPSYLSSTSISSYTTPNLCRHSFPLCTFNHYINELFSFFVAIVSVYQRSFRGFFLIWQLWLLYLQSFSRGIYV